MQSNHENHQYKQDFVPKKFNNLMRNYEKLREFGHNYMQKNEENHQYIQDFMHKKFNNLMRNYEKLR